MTRKPFFSGPLTGRHVLVILLLFFGVIITVNGIFIYQAEKTWRGLESKHAYEEGLAYNRTLAAAEAQKALGWQTALDLTAQGLNLRVLDRDGAPVAGLVPRATIARPADEASDRSVTLRERGNGHYEAALTLPYRGQWLVTLEMTTPKGQPYRIEERFVLP